MKRILLSTFGLAVLTASCVDLDEELISGVSSEYYATPDGLNAAVIASYGQLRSFYGREQLLSLTQVGTDTWMAADQSGSTDFIIRTVKASPEGSVWAVATEIHLVNRLAREVAPARTVLTLDSLGCLCSTMFRVSPNHLLWVLEGLIDGQVHNQIVVPEPTKTSARSALDRMLALP